MNVDRCVCFNLTFAQLKELARKESLDFEQLKERTQCCANCSMCEPYIRRMLSTGEVVFPLLSGTAADRGAGGGRSLI